MRSSRLPPTARDDPSIVDHHLFTSVQPILYHQRLTFSELQSLRAAFASKQPLLLRCAATPAQCQDASVSWAAFVESAAGTERYTTQGHGKRSLRDVWQNSSGLRIETGLNKVESNVVRDWLRVSEPGSFIKQLALVQEQLDALSVEFKRRRSSAVRYPSFISGLTVDGGGTTHFDTYTNLALVTVGHKVFYIAPSTEDSPINLAPVRGRLNERRGVNPYNSESFVPPLARLDTVPRECWTVAALDPGDILYLPSGYWHWVSSSSHTVMTNCWSD